jgi:tetratricopeptide (TPR) repeat protein
MLLALAGLAAACGEDESTATTATASSSVSASPSPDATTAAGEAGETSTTVASGGTTTVSAERVVVGGEEGSDYSAQIPELQKALASDPDNLETLQELAIAQYNTGKYEQAAATYQKMLQLKDDAFTHNNYANVLRDWQKTDEAIANYEKAISLDSSLATPYVNLASVLARQGLTAEAIALLQKGLNAVSAAEASRLQTYLEQLQSAE